jgi:myosin heavy subunit
VKRINAALEASQESETLSQEWNTIGCLDIFGFEGFQKGEHSEL